ncbi:hypothetical protein ACFYZJ_14430 [Streptomyces sp. NPDC001848]|uniref:hypothetical protein n=1 Tax=Streptomyces sp. NPDC001848 TaxID=3364618 RepID=UPI0036C11B6E
MKSLKAAAVVAGSLVVAGVAAPAFADDASGLTPTSLNGALETITTQKTLDVRPIAHQSETLDTENKHSVLRSVNGAAAALNRQVGASRLLGGLPLRGGR